MNNCDRCAHRFPDLDQEWHDDVVGLPTASGEKVMQVALSILGQVAFELIPGHLSVADTEAWTELIELHCPEWSSWGEVGGVDDVPTAWKFLEELTSTARGAVADWSRATA